MKRKAIYHITKEEAVRLWNKGPENYEYVLARVNEALADCYDHIVRATDAENAEVWARYFAETASIYEALDNLERC